MRTNNALFFLFLSLAAIGCKSRDKNQSDTKAVGTWKKVTVVKGNDGKLGEAALITCGSGYYDKETGLTEFAVIPFSKVENLKYTELEAIYCTELIAGTGQGGGGNAPTPTTDGFTQIDPVACKQEGVELPVLTNELKRVYVPQSSTDRYDNCIVFAEEFEKMIAKLVTLKKSLIDKRIRIYASLEANAIVKYDETDKKLFVPFKIAGKIGDLIAEGGKIVGGPGLQIHTFAQQPRFLWTARSGLGSWIEAKNYCDGIGQPWTMPTADQLQQVKTDLNANKLGQLFGTTNNFYANIQILNPASPTTAHFTVPGNGPSAGEYPNMGILCVIDVGA